MAFDGYLIKFIGAGGVKTELPLKYIRYETFKISPEQRQNLNPGEDTRGVMHRNVVPHTRTKIEFMVPMMSNVELDPLLTLLRTQAIYGELVSEYDLEYYSPRTNSYHTGHFYLADTIDLTIRNVDAANRIINYAETRLAFIEM